jgi:hypothetical protein
MDDAPVSSGAILAQLLSRFSVPEVRLRPVAEDVEVRARALHRHSMLTMQCVRNLFHDLIADFTRTGQTDAVETLGEELKKIEQVAESERQYFSGRFQAERLREYAEFGLEEVLLLSDEEIDEWARQEVGEVDFAVLYASASKKALASIPDAGRYCFRRTGDMFQVRFDGEHGLVEASLAGARYVYQLLQQPNIPITVEELRGDVRDFGGNENKERLDGVRQQISDLVNEIALAKRNNDQATADRAREELSQLETDAKRLIGINGRPRNQAGESARVAVTNAIRLMIGRCKRSTLPRFAAHLEDFLSFGSRPEYRPPSPPPDWQF